MRKPLRDAAAATAALLLAIYVGSGRLAHLDRALLGYLGASVVAFAGATYRASAFWRRPPSAFYARMLAAALLRALRDPSALRVVLQSASSDLLAQSFVARRARVRWIGHLLLSLGTLASFAITLPLVFGWLHFAAAGPDRYRAVVLGLPTASFAVEGAVGWLAFHGLSLAGSAVLVGTLVFLTLRLRQRALPGVATSFHLAPLVLLLIVAATGLALPATRHAPRLFDVASAAHEVAVIVLLAAIPFSKLHHVLIRPLQLGARVVQRTGDRVACAVCGGPLAPRAQRDAVRTLLEARGLAVDALDCCPSCRRLRLATTQAALVGAQFHPPVLGTHAMPDPTRRAA
ncbi:hypothetical protein K2Z84_28445 [Candidatus Binatia bacterium]|nr:hypothetical protein [Candidatus Binatia bacterium]